MATHQNKSLECSFKKLTKQKEVIKIQINYKISFLILIIPKAARRTRKSQLQKTLPFSRKV